MAKFQELNQIIIDVSTQFEYMDLKRRNIKKTEIPPSSPLRSSRSSSRLTNHNNNTIDDDVHRFYGGSLSDSSINCSTSDLLTAAIRKSRSNMEDAQIKSHNLLLELKEYSDKIIQLTKVFNTIFFIIRIQWNIFYI